ncbi:MAG: sigma 54-interacting transcriptional regulator, partial [Thermoanaerobaculia bacterium]
MADLIWNEVLADVERCERVERLWTGSLQRLYPELQIADFSARFLRPWRRLGAERVPLPRLGQELSIPPVDLPGWHVLVAHICQVLSDADQETRDLVTLQLSREFLESARVSRPDRPRRLHLISPSPRSTESYHLLPEHWTERGGLVGSGQAMQDIVRRSAEVARDRYPTLILGETGSGKDVVARLIHHLSTARGRFVAINCAALPEHLIESELFGYDRGAFTGASDRRAGLFAAADGGTLMLDEVSEIPLQHQAKILRVLQDGLVRRVGSSKYEAVDARIIATSNRDLEESLTEGRLRRDLYYRLAVHEIRVPSLRDHLEDIPELVAALLDRWHRVNPNLPMPVIDNGAVEKLSDYTWPGNVRQLEHTVYRLASRFSGRRITSASIEAMVDSPSPGIGQA